MTFNEVVNRGRPHGSEHWVEVRFVAVRVWAGGLIEREISYADLDEARAAAERLVEERG